MFGNIAFHTIGLKLFFKKRRICNNEIIGGVNVECVYVAKHRIDFIAEGRMLYIFVSLMEGFFINFNRIDDDVKSLCKHQR